ncbi:MAG: hypothetical protein AB1679_01365 [Actinomycetota bacterium]|jgi:hypothetical protein
MTPVLARCERCHGGFPLFTIVAEGTGACPHCGQPLASHPTAALVEWAAVVDAACGRLITAVRQLQQLPGHLNVNTDQLVRDLAQAIGASSNGAFRSPTEPSLDRRHSAASTK